MHTPSHAARQLSVRRLATCLALLLVSLTLGGGALAESSAVVEVDPPREPPARPMRTPVGGKLAVRGIYVQQHTAENPNKLDYLIENALDVGLNTFVVDLWSQSSRYEAAVRTIQRAGLRYVPRIILFPEGGTPEQVSSRRLLEKRWRLVDYALGLGAEDVQLDYVRYATTNRRSPENARRILEVVRFFKKRIAERGARLQVDVFGHASYGPLEGIGQDVALFAPDLDGVCPMVYPSHFEPYAERARTPYRTVHGALTALSRQIEDHPIPVYAYIELFNFRHPMSDAERMQYFQAQVEAVEDAGGRGFYAWSVGNYYDLLFEVMRRPSRDRPRSAARRR